MGSHSVTCHPTQVNMPRQTPAMQAGTQLTYPGGMEGWVDLVDLIVSHTTETTASMECWILSRATFLQNSVLADDKGTSAAYFGRVQVALDN